MSPLFVCGCKVNTSLEISLFLHRVSGLNLVLIWRLSVARIQVCRCLRVPNGYTILKAGTKIGFIEGSAFLYILDLKITVIFVISIIISWLFICDFVISLYFILLCCLFLKPKFIYRDNPNHFEVMLFDMGVFPRYFFCIEINK